LTLPHITLTTMLTYPIFPCMFTVKFATTTSDKSHLYHYNFVNMNNKLFLPLLHKFVISTRRLKFVGNQNYQHSCLLAYDAALLGQWFPVFRRTVAPSSCLTLKMKALQSYVYWTVHHLDS